MENEFFNNDEMMIFQDHLPFAIELYKKGWLATRKDGNYTFPDWGLDLFYTGVLFDPGSGFMTDPSNLNWDEKPCKCDPYDNKFPAIFWENGELTEGYYSFPENELQQSCYNCHE